jgi:hypothetical protein
LNIEGYIKPGEMANWELGLTTSFELLELANASRTLCNSAIMVITDGAPAHYEEVFKLNNSPVKVGSVLQSTIYSSIFHGSLSLNSVKPSTLIHFTLSFYSKCGN